MSLPPEAVENAARLVLNQLAERLDLSMRHLINVDEMECMQFGIGALPAHSITSIE